MWTLRMGTLRRIGAWDSGELAFCEVGGFLDACEERRAAQLDMQMHLLSVMTVEQQVVAVLNMTAQQQHDVMSAMTSEQREKLPGGMEVSKKLPSAPGPRAHGPRNL